MKTFIFTILFVYNTNLCFSQFNISVVQEKLKGINNVEFLNNVVFIVDNSNLSLISYDRGKSFERIEFPSNAQILNDSILFSHSGNSMTFSIDNGLTKFKKPYLKNNGDTIKQIAATGSNYIFNNGKGFITSYSNLKPKIYLTENWGDSWEEQDSSRFNFSDLPFGISSTKQKYIFNSSFYSMRTFNDSIIYQYFHYGDSIVERNLIKSGIVSSVLYIAFKDELNGMVITRNKNIFITNDGCNSFKKINTINDSLIGFLSYAKSTKNRHGFYILALKNGGSIFSKDDGKTWYKNLDNNYLFSMDFYDAETGIVTIGKDIDKNTNIFYFTDLVNNVNEQVLLNNFSIYPNPAINNLNIQGLNSNFNYKIINLVGQVVLSGSIKNIDNTIDISTLKPSTYLINLETESGSKMYKFIKIAY